MQAKSPTPAKDVVPSKDVFRFLPVSARDRQWGLYVTAAGYESIPPQSVYPLSGHSRSHDWVWHQGRTLQEYAVVYIVKGEGEFESKATGQRAIEAGSAMLLFPGVWHRYRPLKAIGWDEYWVTFRGEDADRLIERGFLTPEEPVLQIGLNDQVLGSFRTLLKRVRSESLGLQPLISAGTLEIIAGMLSSVHQQGTSSHVQEVVRRAKLAMEGSMESLPAVKDLVENSGMSPSYFHQVFKESTGLSPYQYRLQVQMQSAKDLLHNSDLSIKQISYAVKFHSVYQFAKIFKKRMGMTAGQYRRGKAAGKAGWQAAAGPEERPPKPSGKKRGTVHA